MEQIIKANNKQSVVPDEAFIALDQFHKQLQQYYRQASKKLQAHCIMREGQEKFLMIAI